MRIKNKLTPLALKKINHPGRYSDGNNLYLKVEETGSKRWILRLRINGRRRDINSNILCINCEYSEFIGLVHGLWIRDGGACYR